MIRKRNPLLGILRLDYNYPAAIGDIDHPDTFNYDIIYRVIPGLTFKMCQSGNITEEVKNNCIKAVNFLDSKGVNGITGDCGFMINIQDIIIKHTKKPVFLSSLIQLPTLIHMFNDNEKIAIFTANGKSLNSIKNRIDNFCNLDKYSNRYTIVGCENIDGFEAVELGEKVDINKVTPGIIKLGKNIIRQDPSIKCILFECTELPPYSDALRYELNLPIYDAITMCDSFMSGYLDNKNFGLNDWQDDWDHKQINYTYGDNLSINEKKKLINKI